jgi:hypothetical protein
MAFRRTEGATLLLSRSLALAESDAPLSRSVGFPAGYAPLAIVGVCLLLWLLVTGSFWAGRMVEQRSELGRLLASAPAVEELEAATRQADSLGMQMMLQLGRLHRRRGT